VLYERSQNHARIHKNVYIIRYSRMHQQLLPDIYMSTAMAFSIHKARLSMLTLISPRLVTFHL